MSSETAMITQAWAGVGSGIVALLVGAAQCFLIWVGLRQINKASTDRNRQLDQQEKAAADRHQESMRTLEVLLERQEKTAADRHQESMRALEALIERTGRAS